MNAEQRTFTTEVQQLLHLMIHSLYSKREVFLRELISNASDALDTVRFTSLTEPEVKAPEDPAVLLQVDKDARTVTIMDNGVGMTRDEVVKNIGTIAHSGTAALLARLKQGDKKDAPELIGQFGVGFYSAFMVADKIELYTLSARPGAEGVRWASEGGAGYELGPAEGGRRSEPGTTIVLHLKKDADEFLEDWRLEQIVKEYSNFVKWPVRLREKRLNQSTALWAKRPSEVTDDEHKHFFQELGGGFGGMDGDEKDTGYLAKLHLSLDAPYQFQALLYIPKKPPFDLMFEPHRRKGMQLYVRRVFIMDHAEELLPPYLRFVRGVVDSDDLPLNVSREILQKNQVIAAIQKTLVKKVLEELRRIKDDKEREGEYRAFFQEFGTILKEGSYLDAGNRDKLADLLLFGTMKTPADQVIGLSDYVAAMAPEQKDIYYITGPSRAVVEQSPLLEALRARGFDVLFLTEAIDEWVAQGITEYREKKLVPVHKGELKLPDAPEQKAESGETKQTDQAEGEVLVGGLVAHLRVRFQDALKEVRTTNRLTDSPSCLVVGEYDMGHNMAQILKRHNQKVPEVKPILELNPKSSYVLGLAKKLKAEPLSEEVAQGCDLLLELAYLSQGMVHQPARLVSQVSKLLADRLNA